MQTHKALNSTECTFLVFIIYSLCQIASHCKRELKIERPIRAEADKDLNNLCYLSWNKCGAIHLTHFRPKSEVSGSYRGFLPSGKVVIVVLIRDNSKDIVSIKYLTKASYR